MRRDRSSPTARPRSNTSGHAPTSPRCSSHHALRAASMICSSSGGRPAASASSMRRADSATCSAVRQDGGLDAGSMRSPVCSLCAEHYCSIPETAPFRALRRAHGSTWDTGIGPVSAGQMAKVRMSRSVRRVLHVTPLTCRNAPLCAPRVLRVSPDHPLRPPSAPRRHATDARTSAASRSGPCARAALLPR